VDNAQPVALVMSGPNGAGKSTASPILVHEMAGIDRYINADAIARGLSPFEPDKSAITAGRMMLEHIDELSRSRRNFALETTLSGVRLASRLAVLQELGYRVHLIYLWLPSPTVAIQRVEERVMLGGHSIAPDVITRRFHRSLRNLMGIYIPMSDAWRIYDNSAPSLRLIAHGLREQGHQVIDKPKWMSIHRYADERSFDEK
jgi:predicted ABC-type ATPase